MLAAEMLQEFYLATISDQHPPTPFRGCSRWIKSSQRRKRGEEEEDKKKTTKTTKHLLCNGRELEDVEGFVVHGGALVDVDDHAGFAAAAEEALQVVGQLALPEGNVLR